MSRVLITVGGTGQHVALAVTRLVHLGALTNDIKLVALDADTETPLLGASASLWGDKEHPLQDPIVKPPFDVARFGKKNFGELFVDADHDDERELFESLFTADDASIPVHLGMFGTPCVGATVFAEGAQDQLKPLLAPLASAEKIFVCGSVVGGTGAGLIHKLVREIRTKNDARDLFGLFLLRWFDVDGATSKAGITPDRLQRNESHGIKHFYDHTIPHLTASMVIGYPGEKQTAVLKKTRMTPGVMKETPSYLHLVAAYGLVALPAARVAHRDVKAYGFAHDDTQETYLLDAKWDGDRTLRACANALQVRHNLLRFLTQPANRSKLLDYYTAGWVKRRLRGESAWGDLHSSVLTCKGDGDPDFVGALLDRFEAIRAQDELCITWLKELFPGDLLDKRTDGTRPKILADLAEHERAGSESPYHWAKLREIWAGKPMTVDPNIAYTGGDIAEHHAGLLRTRALEGASV